MKRGHATTSHNPTLPHFAGSRFSLFLVDAKAGIEQLAKNSVDCIVTSPPYYGQRDYGMRGQIGLEADPLKYVEKLVEVFAAAKTVLKPTGSLWINLGDTYWSGKGAPHGPDAKNKHRRFVRPQDRTSSHKWCRSKQLLLLPHRLAISLQEDGWILRNDNVWHKLSPTPDPVKDRCASAHEYFFHFVRSRHYYFNFDAVAVPCATSDNTKPLASVWAVNNRPNFKKHIAVFPAEIVKNPILATLPERGTILDPFCGSGTVLEAAAILRPKSRRIGIDLSASALREAVSHLKPRATAAKTPKSHPQIRPPSRKPRRRAKARKSRRQKAERGS